MSDRITYFSNQDLSLWHYLPRVESVLRNFDSNNTISDINDAIELYHITLFIDNGARANSWSEGDITDFEQKTAAIKRCVYQYFSQLQPDNIVELYAQIEFNYQETFWEIINKFKLWSIVDDDTINNILNTHEGSIRYFLHHQGLVKKYEVPIIQYFKSHPQTAEILLSAFIEEDKFGSRKPIYIPKGLTIDEREQIISNYIDSTDPNLNYLQLIPQITKEDKANLRISPKVRLKAEKIAAKISDEFFKDKNTGIQYGFSIIISPEKGLPPVQIKSNRSSLHIEYIYSEEYILSCSGVQHLENFLRLFGIFDRYGLISFVFHKYDATSLFDMLGMRAKKEFPSGSVSFKMFFQTALGQTAAYMQTLEKNGIYIEDIIKTFYNETLKNEYGYKGLSLNVPGHDLSWLEKVRALIPEIESIVRQYNLYLAEGEIDPEVLELTDAIKITDCGSMIPNKYIYLTIGTTQQPNMLQRVLHDFFSDQSMLDYVEPYKEKRYNSLYQLLLKEIVLYDNYELYQKSEIDWLIDNHYLSKRDDGALTMSNPKLMGMLYDLYKCDVCLYWNYDADTRLIIDDYLNKDYLYAESTLLSHPEQDLFSFVFNNERFSNALAYRNKYLHGNPPTDAKHYNVYVISIMMLICLLFKIEHDLQVGQDLKSY